jgi:uncharacterized membrane protein
MTTGVVQPDTKPSPTRIDSVDLLRGIVMVIMALDHVRDFFHADALLYDPLDLTQTSVALFLTRWITHFCAPVFVFLAGTGAYLSTLRGKHPEALSRFLWTRGLFLVVMEFTIVRLAWMFSFDVSLLFAQVIWALGVSMIVLAALVRLPLRATAAFSIGMILIHNAFDGITMVDVGSLGWVWSFLHSGEVIQISETIQFWPVYPLIPWIGVMAAGYVFGALFRMDPETRKRRMLSIGLSMVAAFVVLRALNVYGDPVPWTSQESAGNMVLSFINTTKYPPSLLFLLMTLGPSILALPFLERGLGKAGQVLIVFGRVPMFFYILHLYLIHALAVCAGGFSGFSMIEFMTIPFEFPQGSGFDLATTYGVWLAVVVVLYPLCRWYAGLKARRKSPWMSYL